MDRLQSVQGWRLSLASSWLVLAIFAVPATAQEHRFELSAEVRAPGWLHTEDSDRLLTEDAFGIGLRYFWRPSLSAEVGAFYDDDASLAGGEGAVLIHFQRDRKWSPYVGGGLHYEQSDDLDQEATALLLVGGVDWWIVPRLGFRFVARALPVELSGHAPDSDLVGNLGLTLRF